MKCDWLTDKQGKVVGILCGSRRRRGPKFNCQECLKREHTKLCDYRAPGIPKSCDRKLCDECAVEIAKDIDYCPGHPR